MILFHIILFFIPYEKHNIDCIWYKKMETILYMILIPMCTWMVLLAILVVSQRILIYHTLFIITSIVSTVLNFCIWFPRLDSYNRSMSVRYIEKKYNADYLKIYSVIEECGISKFPIANLENNINLDQHLKSVDTIDDIEILRKENVIFDQLIQHHENKKTAERIFDRLRRIELNDGRGVSLDKLCIT